METTFLRLAAKIGKDESNNWHFNKSEKSDHFDDFVLIDTAGRMLYHFYWEYCYMSQFGYVCCLVSPLNSARVACQVVKEFPGQYKFIK